MGQHAVRRCRRLTPFSKALASIDQDQGTVVACRIWVTVYEEVWFPCFPREWREARVAMAKIAWFRNWLLGLSEMSSGMKGYDDGGAAGRRGSSATHGTEAVKDGRRLSRDWPGQLDIGRSTAARH
jgi:hypothetical protein